MKLLVPLDGSQLAEQVLPHVVAFARRFESEVYCVQVIHPEGADPDKPLDGLDWELRCARCICYLEEVKKRLAEQGVSARCDVIEGDPATQIVDFCRRKHIDLLVLAAQGAGGAARFDRGGTVQKVMSRVDHSLLLVAGPVPADLMDKGYHRILVPVDGSKRSEWAVSVAATMASGHEAELDLLQVIEEPRMSPRVRESQEGREAMEKLVSLNREEAQRRMEEAKVLLPGNIATSFRVTVAPEVAPAIERAADEAAADLLVLTAHGWSADRRQPYGPIVGTLLAHASRPVLVLQDALEHGFVLKPAAGLPVRSTRVERRHRAEAS